MIHDPCIIRISWPKHVGVHCVYELILIYLCAFVGTFILYTVNCVCFCDLFNDAFNSWHYVALNDGMVSEY
jgi:hypothetical protein